MKSRMSVREITSAWAADRGGAVAVIFGICLLAISLTSALAIDFARGSSLQISLQNDLDAAVLGAATSGVTEAQMVEAAKTYFGQNWKEKYGITDDVDVAITKPTDTTVRGVARVKVPTTLMAIAGIEDLDITVTSEIELTGENIEVALVLDVTESMAGAKIDALKASAEGLIDKAFAKADARNHIKMSIVLFADYVNVGDANRNASWMSVPLDSSSTQEVCNDNYQDVIGTSNCRDETFSGDRDGVPYSYTAQVCDYQYGPPYRKCWDSTTSTAWYGCAASRPYPLDTQDQDYGTPFPGAVNVMCGDPLLPLPNDIDALKARIAAISTFGNTYIPAGLLWGWNTLSKSEPFTEAVEYGERINGVPVEKALVLMTDGANTRSPDYAANYHWGSDVALANARTADFFFFIFW